MSKHKSININQIEIYFRPALMPGLINQVKNMHYKFFTGYFSMVKDIKNFQKIKREEEKRIDDFQGKKNSPIFLKN